MSTAQALEKPTPIGALLAAADPELVAYVADLERRCGEYEAAIALRAMQVHAATQTLAEWITERTNPDDPGHVLTVFQAHGDQVPA